MEREPDTIKNASDDVTKGALSEDYIFEFPEYIPVPWRELANCKDEDTEIFFPKKGETTQIGKAVCSICVVKEECLEYALVTGQPDGIWGGLSATERKAHRRRWLADRRIDQRVVRRRVVG